MKDPLVENAVIRVIKEDKDEFDEFLDTPLSEVTLGEFMDVLLATLIRK